MLLFFPPVIQEKVFQQLFQQAEIAQFSEDEYQDYEDSLKDYRDLKNSIDTAYDDGKSDGIQEGIEQGIEQGKIETAKNLLKLDIPIEKIILATGLTKEEVKNIV